MRPPTVGVAIGDGLGVEARVRELRETLGLPRARVRVAVLPPLAHTKIIPFPPLRDEVRRRVLVRDAARYFVGVGERMTVAAAPVRGSRGAPAQLRVTAVPAQLVAELHLACAAVGWSVESIETAHETWCAGALAGCQTIRRGHACVIVLWDGVAYLHLLRDRLIERVRRTAARAPDVLMALREEGAPLGEHPSRPTVVVGEEPERARIERALADAGAEIVSSDGIANVADPAALAASHRGLLPALELLPDAVLDARRRTVRHTMRAAAAIAAVGCAVMAGAELWGARRDAQRAADRRRELATYLGKAMHVRDALRSLDLRLVTIDSLGRTAPEWSATIASLSAELPHDAHLLALRARSDSLLLEGVAERATSVFAALERAPGVGGVRASAPIRQELDARQRPVEHFALALRLQADPDTTERRQ